MERGFQFTDIQYYLIYFSKFLNLSYSYDKCSTRTSAGEVLKKTFQMHKNNITFIQADILVYLIYNLQFSKVDNKN